MYRCCNIRRFLRLLFIDMVFIAVTAFFVNTSGCFDTSGAGEKSIVLYAIMYHSISEFNNGEYIVSPEEFENDLSWLKANGYQTVLPSELVSYVKGETELGEKCVMITFDDGCYNNLYHALPLLEKYDYSAVVSVVGEFVEVNAQKDPHVEQYSYLTWGDIDLLIESGRIEIGNHTYSLHDCSHGRIGAGIMYGESEENYVQMLYSDISKLQNKMHENTGLMPICFAYPYGNISRESIPVLRKLGFYVTLSCREVKNTIVCGNFDSLYGIGRFNRSGNISTEQFMQKVFQ